MPEKPPYFPFYPKDFVTDEKVMNMCTEAVGSYIRLLCAAWIANPPATIPNDDAALARLAGLTPLRWAELRAEVLSAWSPTKDGRLTQRRLACEYHKADRKIRAARRNGKLGGRPSGSGKETQGFATANPMGGIPDQNQTRVEKNKPPPTKADVGSVAGYAREVVGVDLRRLVVVEEILSDFGLAGVVEVLEHLASRRPSERFKGITNQTGFVKSLLAKAEDGPLNREHDFESFEDWKIKADARVAAKVAN